MFVYEDPGRTSNTRIAQLQQARARSLAASIGHQRRKLQQKARASKFSRSGSNTSTDSVAKVSSPPASSSASSSSSSSSSASDEDDSYDDGQNTTLQPISLPAHINDGLVGAEAQAIQFFRHRTALRWAGWQDAQFWNVTVLQIAADYAPVKHALVSLGAYHEFLESKEALRTETLQSLSLAHTNKTLKSLAEGHDKLPISVILMTHIMFARVAASLNPLAYYHALKLEFALVEEIQQLYRYNISHHKPDLEFILRYIEPIVARQASRDAQSIDPLFCLRNTPASHFFTQVAQIDPLKIDSLLMARDALEQILNWATYVVKMEDYPMSVMPRKVDYYLSRWSQDLSDFAERAVFSRKEYHCLEMLKLSAKFGVMMIETMNTDDEMVFDDYIALYAELIEVLRGYLSSNAYNLKADVRFGMSPGFLVLAGNTAIRWCRQPDLRTQLISLIRSAQNREAGESIILYAQLVSAIQRVEERGLVAIPKSCHDMPASNRVIIVSVTTSSSNKTQRVSIIRDPWDTCVMEELYLPYLSSDTQTTLLCNSLHPADNNTEYVAVMGRGYRAWLDTDTGQEWRVKDPKFFFPLPRT